MKYANCIYCETAFHQKTSAILHCSAKCANTNRIKPHIFLICINCKQTFEAFPSQVNRKYCSRNCSNEYMMGKNSPHWRGGACLQHGRYWERIKQAVYDRDKVCRNCGAKRSPSGRRLAIHHIDPRRNYVNQDEANIIENLVALCAVCHGKLEMAITHSHVQLLPKHLKALTLVQ